jgi:predicted nucleic acid-binding protein
VAGDVRSPLVNDPFDPLLPDTSAWVHYLRPGGAADLQMAMREALAQGRVAACSVVRMELLIGSRDPAAFDTLLEALRGVIDVPITEERWEEAARLGYDLRKQGLLVPLPDLLIAQCAISSERVVWHADEDFERIRERSSLRTRSWRTAD